MNALKIIAQRISSYNVLVNILPGIALYLLLKYVVGIELLPDEHIGIQLVALYLIGLVNNRFGSIVIEPVLKRIGIISFVERDKYLRASSNSKVTEQSMINNSFRSYIAVITLTLSIYLFKLFYHSYLFELIIDQGLKLSGLVLLLILFIVSYQKQTNYVKSTVNYVLQQHEENIADTDDEELIEPKMAE